MKDVIGRLLALIGTALLIACVAGRFTYIREGTLAPGKIRYAGVRSSGYGIRPFPQPGTWQTAVKNVSAVLNGAAPCAVWIVGVLHSDRTSCRLEFPPDGRNLDHIVFSEED